jgi:hypothetical protein
MERFVYVFKPGYLMKLPQLQRLYSIREENDATSTEQVTKNLMGG